jgi:FMN phosphatase YigB (HAD superfamily)
MKTLIFDIDGTITDIWPIEKTILLSLTDKKFKKEIEEIKAGGVSDTYKIFCKISAKKISKKQYFFSYNQATEKLIKKSLLPAPKKYPLIDWILKNRSRYYFVFATGGQKSETLFVLRKLNLVNLFDLKNSVDKTTYRFSKKTGRPFKKIKTKFPNCLLITDGKQDCAGAILAGVPFVLIKPGQTNFDFND